jgi:hypothetical protein
MHSTLSSMVSPCRYKQVVRWQSNLVASGRSWYISGTHSCTYEVDRLLVLCYEDKGFLYPLCGICVYVLIRFGSSIQFNLDFRLWRQSP